MIARISPTTHQLVAACFPAPGCTVRGYYCTRGTRYHISLHPHCPGLPESYPGTGRTCYEALAAAVQLFHDTAHAYPAARPLAAAGSYDGASSRADSF